MRTPVRLEGDVTADICVVGAGYSGLSSALHLAQKGLKVVVVEGAAVGWGASGRNGGQVVNGLNASLGTIERRYGEDTAAFVGGLVQEGAGIIYDWVERYGIDCDLKRGNIYAAYTPKHMQELEAKQALWRRYGMDDHELLDAERHPQAYRQHRLPWRDDRSFRWAYAPAQSRAGRGQCAREPRRGHLRALAGTGVTQGNGTATVTTATGKVTANAVLVCGNAYLGDVVPELTARVMPVSTQMMATEPLDAERGEAAAADRHVRRRRALHSRLFPGERRQPADLRRRRRLWRHRSGGRDRQAQA